MLVRAFEDADSSAVVDILNDVLPSSTPHNDPAASVQRKAEHQDGLFLVAEENGVVVGTVMAGYDGHRGWIYSLAVRSEFQRRGVGSALVKHAEKELEKKGCPKLNLQVRSDNESVIGFYRAMGYGIEDRISMGKLTGAAGSHGS